MHAPVEGAEKHKNTKQGRVAKRHACFVHEIERLVCSDMRAPVEGAGSTRGLCVHEIERLVGKVICAPQWKARGARGLCVHEL
jgi:hypothetical protein